MPAPSVTRSHSQHYSTQSRLGTASRYNSKSQAKKTQRVGSTTPANTPRAKHPFPPKPVFFGCPTSYPTKKELPCSNFTRAKYQPQSYGVSSALLNDLKVLDDLDQQEAELDNELEKLENSIEESSQLDSLYDLEMKINPRAVLEAKFRDPEIKRLQTWNLSTRTHLAELSSTFSHLSEEYNALRRVQRDDYRKLERALQDLVRAKHTLQTKNAIKDAFLMRVWAMRRDVNFVRQWRKVVKG